MYKKGLRLSECDTKGARLTEEASLSEGQRLIRSESDGQIK